MDNDKNRIAILDYVGARVIVRDMEEGEQAEEAAERLAGPMGLHLSDCEYMSGALQLDIEESASAHNAAPKVPQARIRQMESARSGRGVANQWTIETDAGEFFQSYQSIIAYRPKNGGRIMLDARTWDYSTTTGRYRNEFLGEGIEETRKKIASGEYLLADLNK